MADFVAVLKKTLDGMGEPSPEVRQRVYERARATVLAKLRAVSPPPTQAVTDRQMQVLEDAIATVERGYAPAPKRADPLDELEDVFASLNGLKDRATIPPRPVAPPPKVEVPMSRATPVAELRPTPKPASLPPASTLRTDPAKNEVRPAARPERPVEVRSEATPIAKSETPPTAPATEVEAPPREAGVAGPVEYQEDRRGGFGKAIAAVLVLAALAGGGYAVWLNKDDFSRMVGLTPPADAVTTPLQTEPSPPPAEDVAAAPPPEAAAPEPAVAEPGAVAPEPVVPEPASVAPEAAPAVKLTQKLNADGSEVDAGRAGGEPAVGEGTSVAGATVPSAPPVTEPTPAAAAPPPVDTAANPPVEPTPPADPATPPPADTAANPPVEPTPPADPATPPVDTAAVPPVEPTPPAAPAADPNAQATPAAAPPPADQPIAIGQKAIFYEERTTSAQGSAEAGATVWSVVQEAPGADRPPEPAIRAEATIPGKDVQLRMTIRRNTDPTLPASHIVELIFLMPENFDGGGVDSVLRMAMKDSEQDTGSPLNGIPAKISDNFFLLALNDNQAVMTQNMNLLNREKWIDIPIVYKSGRRALITMEKGIPGEKVFGEALKAWGVPNAG